MGNGNLELFNSKVQEFLGEYIEQNKVSLRKIIKQMNEQIIGNYEADSLEVEIGANTICFDPIGRYIIGARGRVDMNGPHGTVKFLLGDPRTLYLPGLEFAVCR